MSFEFAVVPGAKFVWVPEPDGTPLEERGIEPQVAVASRWWDFLGKRDPVLAAALDRLRAAPLPDKPLGTSLPDSAPASPQSRSAAGRF